MLQISIVSEYLAVQQLPQNSLLNDYPFSYNYTIPILKILVVMSSQYSVQYNNSINGIMLLLRHRYVENWKLLLIRCRGMWYRICEVAVLYSVEVTTFKLLKYHTRLSNWKGLLDWILWKDLHEACLKGLTQLMVCNEETIGNKFSTEEV